MAVSQRGAQRADERGVGKLALAELDAVADQHGRAPLAPPAGELVEQPRLPDPGLAGDKHERGTPLGRVVKGGLQLGELAGPADEAGACHSNGHRRLSILPPHALEGRPKGTARHRAFAYMRALPG